MNRLLTFLFSASVFLSACDRENSESETAAEEQNPKLSKLKLPEGFQAEHLYSPSDNEQGSWVAMTFDDKNRIITADQFGALYRMEVPARGDTTAMKVEKLQFGKEQPHPDDTTKAPLKMGFAQGVLYAFNSLYVMVNHDSDDEFEKSSGLYRLKDTDGDDQFDDIQLLKLLPGEPGEHGPHSIVMAPDNQSLYVIAGNHTDLPKMDSYRMKPVWKDDNLFPQIKDPRGHANNREAPGGWIAHIDSLGENWELISAGYRNPFDLAFNESGEMFTFDSDMEWDLGMPWYRPTRICHVTSGSEFGWRTGNGKWSPSYPDNLPAILNIGQGSPTNVIHGARANFPEEYQQTLFAFDWSFGIIYAIHLTPKGASYAAEKEEFISGMPLPLTDGVIGPDGDLYFLTGGRKLDSDLYRIHYGQDEEEEPYALASYEAAVETEARKVRKELEQFHGKTDSKAVAFAWPYLKDDDRFIQFAARVAIENQPVSSWQQKALAEKDPIILTQAMVALARIGQATQRDQMLQALTQVDYNKLSILQQGDLVRAIELTLSRMGMPGSAMKKQVADYLSPHFPAQTDALNQQLSKVLAYLEAPQVIDKTLTLLESRVDENTSGMTNNATDASDLIMRNPQYGIDIAQTLKNIPPAQHTYYATVLSGIDEGWTEELRERYFKWFYQAFDFQGGRSYIGFIDKARENALTHVPKSKFEYYNQLSGDSLLTNDGRDLASVPQPEGPGKRYELKDIPDIMDSGLVDQNYVRGKNMYAATNCITCHSMQGNGGNIGPDLTQLGTRFSAEDILEAIIDPNKVISDQYVSTVFTLKDGKTVVGRLIEEDDTNYQISQNPFAPDVLRLLAKDEVASTKKSGVSLMPPGLINRMSEEELHDLLAYLISGANPNNELFSADSREEAAE